MRGALAGHPNGMRALVAAGIAACVLAVAGCDSTTTHTFVDCATTVDFHGVTYWGGRTERPPTSVRRLGTGVIPECGADQPAKSVAVHELKGLPVRLGIGVDMPGGDTMWLFTANGNTITKADRRQVDRYELSHLTRAHRRKVLKLRERQARRREQRRERARGSGNG
jgi:hypothetical protein